MACRDYKPILTPYVDGELSERQVRLLKDHLPVCDSCRRTVHLLRMEDRTIRTALLAGGATGATLDTPRIFLRTAVYIAVLLALSVAGLYVAYQALDNRRDTAAAEPRLEAPVLLDLTDAGLDEFAAALTTGTGVPVRAEPGRRPPEVSITMKLVQPIRLRSALDLAADLHGLSWRVENGEILVR